jgi:hypothetical protein
MANPTAANVVVGKPKATGGVYAGATSATLPANAVASLDAALIALGYVSSEGLTQTKGGDVTQIRAWGGDTVRVVKTTDDLSYAWSFIEASHPVITEVFGSSNVSWTDGNGGQKITINGSQVPKRAYVFEILDGTTAIRIVVPNGQIDGQITITFVDGQAVGFPVNLIALPDSSGNKAYWYLTQFVS